MSNNKNNTGHYNSGNYNSGDCNSGDCNSGHYNSGHYNSGNRNSGHCNSGNYNSGWFNTDEPKMRFFNKDSKYTHSEFREKFGYNALSLPLNRWVNKENMTDEEKSSVNGWETMGGYLKTLDYKEAWRVAWEEASQEQRGWYLNLPNFDADIFEEITGIDVNKPEETIEIEGKKYTISEIKKALKESL